jgi:hypothetical protein
MTPQDFGSLALRLMVLVTCVAIVNLARRRASAADRHWLWMLACAGILILPFAARFTPRMQLLPWTSSEAPQAAVPLSSATEHPGDFADTYRWQPRRRRRSPSGFAG